MQVEEKCCSYNVKGKDCGAVEEENTFPSNLYKIIDEVAKKQGYTKYELTKKFISTEGGNYVGVLYEVDIKGKTAGGEQETNLFLKYAINGDLLTIFSVTEVYMKESFTYKELSKIFTELQNEAKIPNEERYKIAKSYDSNTEVIILENLAKKGFTTYYRMDCMSLSFAELSLEQLAKFHSLFYVLEKKRPDYFNKHVKIYEQTVHFNDDWKVFVTNMCDLVKSSADEETKEKIEKLIPRLFEKFPQYSNDTSSIGCTICHGNFRTNNILVKDNNGEALEVVPVDFQLLYYGCPLNDFMYFIFLGSDREFRKKHLNHLKNHYYNNLSKFLSNFDLDIEDLYPRKEFERQFTERLEYGLLVGLFYTPLLFTLEDHVPDIGKQDIKDVKFVLDLRCNERVLGCVDEFVEWGLL